MQADPRDRPTDAWIESLRSRYPTERYVDRALTRKLKARANAAYRPQSTAGIDARLQRLLESRLDSDFQISDIRPLTGGASKEQFSFRLTRPTRDGRSHTEKLVLRITPGASAAETHRLREFQLMGALQGTLPVPEPRWIDPEGDVFGQPCLICSFCEGIAKPPAEAGSAMQMFYGHTHRQALAPQFIAHLAALANFDWSRHDLSSFDPPQPGTREGVILHLNWWQRVWAEDAVCADPLITLVGRWLRDHAPVIDKVSLVHADYRAGNFLFSPETQKITAILDWELAFLGDRHADLANSIQLLYSERDENGGTLVCGLCSREEFLQTYERLSGLPIDPVRLRYYEILMVWRTALMTIGGGARCALDQTSHQDIMFTWLVPAVAPICMRALRELARELF